MKARRGPAAERHEFQRLCCESDEYMTKNSFSVKGLLHNSSRIKAELSSTS